MLTTQETCVLPLQTDQITGLSLIPAISTFLYVLRTAFMKDTTKIVEALSSHKPYKISLLEGLKKLKEDAQG